ncbi:MAG TPA: hypothetical protein VFZ25_04305 [Chloroflexota bacterium]|nr:hypothetical protein [Chloroflexota bacterium]
MNPGSQWIVEFAARENQARERSARNNAGHDGTDQIVTAPNWGQRCLGSVGHLLLVAGAWLNRQAGEVYRAEGTARVLVDRQVDSGSPS